jgi:hypothetical protein
VVPFDALAKIVWLPTPTALLTPLLPGCVVPTDKPSIEISMFAALPLQSASTWTRSVAVVAGGGVLLQVRLRPYPAAGTVLVV